MVKFVFTFINYFFINNYKNNDTKEEDVYNFTLKKIFLNYLNIKILLFKIVFSIKINNIIFYIKLNNELIYFSKQLISFVQQKYKKLFKR